VRGASCNPVGRNQYPPDRNGISAAWELAQERLGRKGVAAPSVEIMYGASGAA
jgi:hypothetical protein